MKIEDFFEFLEDKDIQEKIKEIAHSDNQKEYHKTLEEKEVEIMRLKGLLEKFKKCFKDEEEKNKILSENLSDKDVILLNLEKEKETIKQELSTYKDSLKQVQKQEKKLLNEYNQLQDTFSSDIEAYNIFQELSQSTRSSIDSLFKDKTINGIIICGVQKNNIENFWEYIKTQIIEDKNADLKKLIRLFDILLDKFLLAYPHYAVQQIGLDEKFDPVKHIKTPSSQASGVIKKVLLRGWLNIKTEKVITQSVVEVV